MQKALVVCFDGKLNLIIKEVIAGSNKSVGTIRKFSNVFTKDSLVAIAKTFVRPHFDNSDIVSRST